MIRRTVFVSFALVAVPGVAQATDLNGAAMGWRPPARHLGMQTATPVSRRILRARRSTDPLPDLAAKVAQSSSPRRTARADCAPHLMKHACWVFPFADMSGVPNVALPMSR
jgi:hypothetical protein